jgi:hypothetical protein
MAFKPILRFNIPYYGLYKGHHLSGVLHYVELLNRL